MSTTTARKSFDMQNRLPEMPEVQENNTHKIGNKKYTHKKWMYICLDMTQKV